jgi:ubiquinone/menaquinone biosynthesis C-methylase UbiE
VSATDRPPSAIAPQKGRGFTSSRQFHRPTGIVGWLVGQLMARNNAPMNRLAVELLDAQPGDCILEIGFGPGTAIQMFASVAGIGRIAGVDHSSAMLRQASRRNRQTIRAGRVELHAGTASRLPFPDAHFTKAFAVNSFHHWSSQQDDLLEVRRVLRDNGLLLLCLRMALPKKSLFAPPGMTDEEVRSAEQLVERAGFRDLRTVRRNVGREVSSILAYK